MEELKSTEVLDREILEDARLRAHKILINAEDTLEAQVKDWDNRIQTALDSIRKNYSERSEKIEEEIFARLPLDQRRLRSEMAEKLILKAMEDFLHSLPRDKLLSVLERELMGRLRSWTGNRVQTTLENVAALRIGKILESVTAHYSNLSQAEAEAILKKVPESENWEIKEDSNVQGFPSITINTQSMKINASVRTAAAAILKARRAELASALLSDGVLND